MLTAESMAGRIMNYLNAVPAPDQANTANLTAYRYEILLALCKGIVDEIHENIEVTACQDHPVVMIGRTVVDV